MRLRNYILSFFVLIIICTVSLKALAQLKLTIKDKRLIIKIVLESRDFTDAIESFPDRKPNLLTKNIPKAIQKDFPKTKNVKFKLITPGYIREAGSIYYFSFGNFRVHKRKVFIWFYETNYGGGGRGFEDVFQKVKGKWRIIKPKTIRFKIWST